MNSGSRSKFGSVGAESFGFAIAEGVSMATSLGVVAVADQLIPKPILDHAYHAVGKVLEPWLLDPFEWAKHKFCKLEECQVDKTKSREERAEQMAKILLLFGSSWVISMAAKLKTRRFLNEKMGIHDDYHHLINSKVGGIKGFVKNNVPWLSWTPQERLIFTADEGVHYGSLILMNNQLAPVTDDLIRTATRVISKTTGFNERKSREIADMLVIWEMPNMLGLAAGIGAITGKHAFKWPEGNSFLKKIFGDSSTHVEKLQGQSHMPTLNR